MFEFGGLLVTLFIQVLFMLIDDLCIIVLFFSSFCLYRSFVCVMLSYCTCYVCRNHVVVLFRLSQFMFIILCCTIVLSSLSCACLSAANIVRVFSAAYIVRCTLHVPISGAYMVFLVCSHVFLLHTVSFQNFMIVFVA